MKNRRRADNLMSRVSYLGSKKAPAFTAVTGLSVLIKRTAWRFAAACCGGYLWAAPATGALTRHAAHLIPLLSLAQVNVRVSQFENLKIIIFHLLYFQIGSLANSQIEFKCYKSIKNRSKNQALEHRATMLRFLD